MNHDQKDFLNLANLPARISLPEAAWLLGFAEHDVPVLISAGLLKPLGRPPLNGAKYFATADQMLLRTDTRWLARASDATVSHWKKKNAGRANRDAVPESIHT